MSSVRAWTYCQRCRATYPEGYRVCPRDGVVLETTAVDPLLGAILDGRYRIEAMIGEGALGRIYRARHVRIPRRCAIKVPTDRPSTHEQATQRLLNEAEAGARLDHPNVVGVWDLGETAPGQPYLVMELVEGETLHAHLSRAKRLPVEAALALALQLARGLAHAHGMGLVHRDLAPNNVVITPDGRARILDFGLALVLDGDAQRVTGPGLAVGTPAYMSPEQAAGEKVDARTDVFSLGVLLYQMITGCLPFDDASAMCKTTYEVLPQLDKRVDGLIVDPVVDHLVQAMLARAPDERMGSATAVIDVIGAILAPRTVPVPTWLPAPDAHPAEWAEVPTERIVHLHSIRPSPAR